MATPSEGLAFKGVRDCAIFELLTDTASAHTYDAGFAVTIQEFSANPDINTAELPGNDVTLDRFAKAKGMTGTLKAAKVHTSFLGVLLGATVGTTATTRSVTFTGADLPKYFMIKVKIGYTGEGGDDTVVMTIYKAKLESLEFSHDQDDYAQFSANWVAIPLTDTDDVADFTVYDGDVDLIS